MVISTEIGENYKLIFNYSVLMFKLTLVMRQPECYFWIQ